MMSGLSLLLAGVLQAQNPIVQTCYTSDPAPMVHDGTLYVYTGHDEDHADFFWMQEWRVYSTKDMVKSVKKEHKSGRKQWSNSSLARELPRQLLLYTRRL